MIRLGRQDDVEIFYAFGQKFYQTLGYKIEIDEVRGKEFISFIIDAENGLACTLELKGQVVGCILAICQQHPFASCNIASELIWWVEPEHRGSREALKLFDAYEYWAARKMEAEIISAVSTPGDDKLSKYYQRKKFVPKEITHMKVFV